MDYSQEVQTKLGRVRALMAEHQVSALWLQRVDNVAWITGGVDVAVNIADVTGVASVLITDDRAELWTTTIEAPRLRVEDDVEGRGFELHVSPWEQPMPIHVGGTLAVDVPVDGALNLGTAIQQVRARLLPVEVERFRVLGELCADAMGAAIESIEPGLTEWEISGILADEVRIRTITPIVILIATDERIHRVRHPLPLDKEMERYAMLVLGGRRYGLVCSLTRLLHFGDLSDDLRRRMHACAEIDAAMIAASKPGATLGDIFTITQDAYARAGYEGEWKLHHQGGIAGYSAREFLATPGHPTALEAGMVCAWNPSITGVKFEDTILVTDGAPEVLTAIDGWPVKPVTAGGITIARPIILELEE